MIFLRNANKKELPLSIYTLLLSLLFIFSSCQPASKNALLSSDAFDVTGISPSSGAIAGGTTVTISGSGFDSGTSAIFGSDACTSTNIISSSYMTCVTPAHSAGTVDVIVTNSESTTKTLASAFSYQVAPTVASTNIVSGPSAGGTFVVITGTGFAPGVVASFGGTDCTTSTYVSATTMSCVTAAHSAGLVDVTVTNTDSQSATLASRYTYIDAPSIVSLDVTSGAIAGGTTVTITGTSFDSGIIATVGGTSCSPSTYVNSTSMTCVTPSGSAGTADVVVINSDSQTGTLSSAFTYQAAPTVTGLDITTGPIAGGATITITGTGFMSGVTATFGGTACTTSTYVSATSMTCVTPAHAAGVVDVVVTNSDAQSVTSTNAYTYIAAPAITSLDITSGDAAGGTTVTITGTDFDTGVTASFGGTACTTSTYLSATSMTCVTPAHAAGLVDVVVTNSDSQTGTLSNGYTFIGPPTITSLDVTAGALAGGTTVTVTGTGFLAGITATVDGSACTTPTYVSATTMTCVTPAHAAGTVDVVVTNTDAQTGTLSSGYTYQAAPTITSLDVITGFGVGGTTVTITGTGFLSGVIASFGGTACTTSTYVSATSMTCITPAHAGGLVDVVVTNTDSQSVTSVGAYTFIAAPVITSLDVTAGSVLGGTTITVTGTDFDAGVTAAVDGTACTTSTYISSTSMTCVTPAHAAGTVDVVVTNSDTQTGTLSAGYTYQVAPTITSLDVTAGALAGGTTVTITGTGFLAGITATVDGAACTTSTYVSSTSMTCVTPAHAAATVDVVVTNTDSQSATSVGAYTYQAAPTITSLDVTAGAVSGGTTVTITGTGFLTGVTASLDGTACTTSTYVSATSMTCVTPAHSAGVVDVSVTNTDSQSATQSTAYIYVAAPTVSSLDVTTGTTAGGTTITITGTGFLAGITASVGGTACATSTYVSATSMTCITAAHAAGTVDVVVTNTDSQTGTGTNAFTYLDAPTIVSLDITNGVSSGGDTITITGTNFFTGIVATFGGTACTTSTYVSSTTMTCVTPAHAAGLVDVVVTNTDTQSATSVNAFTYDAAPTITSLDVTSGPTTGGTTITVTGTGFVAGITATLDGTACTTSTYVNATTMTCVSPAHVAGAVDMVVTNTDTQSATQATAFTYIDAPTITSLDVTAGALGGGTTVTITGTGFLTGITAALDGTPCTTSTYVSATSMTCVTPAHAAGTVDVVVTNLDSQTGTLSSSYTYQAAPTVTSLDVTAGALAGGTTVTITGTGFLTGATATVDGIACTTSTYLNATTMTCITPAHAAATVDVVVTNTDTQTGTLASSYTYQAAPTVTSIDVTAGALAGGTTVVVTGTGFVTGITATMGGTACATSTYNSATSMDCVTPANTAGTVDLVVTNTDTQSGTLSSAYTYQAAPTVTSLDVTEGPLVGGDTINITGTGFITGATATIDGFACTTSTYVNSTTLSCVAPAHAAATVDVVVTNTDSQSGTLASSYTYQSMALLEWVVGAGSPNPPDPDSYGATSTNVTHTFTLTNSGDAVVSGVISLTKTGASPGAWLIGTDNCTGNTLAQSATCTVQLTFLGALLSSGAYSANFEATATTSGTASNVVSGTVP